MEDLRTRVIYNYGRETFEQELAELSPDTPLPTDAEWELIQEKLQNDINTISVGLELRYIATHIGEHILSEKDK